MIVFSKFSKNHYGLDEKQLIRKMTRKATTVSPSLSVEEAIECLAKTGQSGVPVTNERGELIGFSQKKIALGTCMVLFILIS